MSRPPLISSTVAAILASIAGLWKLVQATSGPDGDPARGGRQAGQGRPGLPGSAGAQRLAPVQEVVAGPDRIEADGLAEPGELDDLGPAHLALDLGELEADLERPAAGRAIHGREDTRAVGQRVVAGDGSARTVRRSRPATRRAISMNGRRRSDSSRRVCRNAASFTSSVPSTSAGSSSPQWMVLYWPGKTGHDWRARSQTVMT